MRIFLRLRPSIAAVLVVLYVSACYHYVTPKGMTPAEVVAAKHPGQARVTLADSSRLVLEEPWVSADSLGGRLLPRRDSRGSVVLPGLERWAVPLAEVQGVEEYQYNNWAVVGIIAGTVVVVGAIMFAAAVNAMSNQ
jgi:hypothetical protein